MTFLEEHRKRDGEMICECGHKKKDHSSSNRECYVFKHSKEQHFQCICKRFIIKQGASRQ